MKRRTLLTLAVAIAAVLAPAASGARYELTRANGTFTQNAPFQQVEPGSSASLDTSLSFSLVNRPRAELSTTRRTATFATRYGGTGTWSERYEFYNRYNGQVSRGTCGEAYVLQPQLLTTARVRLTLLRTGNARLRMDVPIIGVDLFDCWPGVQTVPVQATLSRTTLARRMFTVRIAGTWRGNDGQFESTTNTWAVTLAFRKL